MKPGHQRGSQHLHIWATFFEPKQQENHDTTLFAYFIKFNICNECQYKYLPVNLNATGTEYDA